jgi:hypothetical protein
MEAAQSFFRNAVVSRSAGWPRKVNLDGNTVELAHRIRKRQFALGYARHHRAMSLKEAWDRALA